MPFNKCLQCDAIREGKCGGPNFMAMSTKEVVEWIIKYQKINGISNAQLAEWSGIPRGTIDGLRYHDDVRHDTIYRVLQALIEGVGGKWGGEPCAIHPESDARTKDTLEHLKRENKFLQETVEHERKHLKHKNRAILTLTITLGILVCGLLVALFLLQQIAIVFSNICFIVTKEKCQQYVSIGFTMSTFLLNFEKDRERY